MSAFGRYKPSAVAVRREAQELQPHQLVTHTSLKDDGFDIKDILKLLRRRAGIIVATAIMVTSVVAIVSFSLTPRYQAHSTVLIEPRESRIVNVESVLEGLPRKEEAIQTEIMLLQSRSYAEQVIEELGLLNDPSYNVFLEPGENDNAVAQWLLGDWLVSAGLAEQANGHDGAGEAQGNVEPAEAGGPHVSGAGPTALGNLTARLQETAARLLPGLGPRPTIEDPGVLLPGERVSRERVMDAATAILLENLEAQQYRDTYIIQITYTSTSPNDAAQVANKLAEIYVKDQLAAKQAATARASTWLGERITELREKLLEAEAAVEKYKVENGLLDSQGVRLNDQQLGTLNQDLIVARADNAEKETKLRLIQDLRSRGESIDSVPEIMGSAVLANLRQQQGQLQREEAQLSQDYGPRHPRILQLQAEKGEVSAKIGAEIQNIVRSLENQAAVARARVQALETNMESAMTDSASRNQADVELRMLQREVDANRSLYTAFLNRLKEVNEQQDLLEAGARVVSKAPVPEMQSFPQPKLMIAAGFTGSLMLGTLFAFLMERLDTGLRSSRQVEQILGVGSLGLVPRVSGFKRRGEVTSYLVKRPQSVYAEAIRAVHTALYLTNVDEPPQVVLVTSSLPGEGKTTLALSLAVSAASSGQKTVIVDLDLRRPHVAKLLDWRLGSAGLVEYMAGQTSLEDIIRNDASLPNLHVIPVKRLAANPTDLLASRKMSALLAELRKQYDCIILDSAPILGISDTKVAARLADVVLFAVRWGKTDGEVGVTGLEALFESHANVAGAVLTQVNLRRHAKYSFGDAAQYYAKYKKYYTN